MCGVYHDGPLCGLGSGIQDRAGSFPLATIEMPNLGTTAWPSPYPKATVPRPLPAGGGAEG